MMHSIVKSLALGLLASASLVAGHCKISAATGDLGGKGTGLGIDPTVDPNSESDVTVFSGSQAKTFGETPGVRAPFCGWRLSMKGGLPLTTIYVRAEISILQLH
jgi:hypothetical protein